MGPPGEVRQADQRSNGGTPGLRRDGELRQAGDRIEGLLEEFRAGGDPVALARAEALVRTVVDVYGAGLARIVELAGTEGAESADGAADGDGGPDGAAARPALVDRMVGDGLVASLLVLHGLHPQDTLTRVQNALDKVRPYLGSHAGGVELLGVDDAGVVRLRLEGSCHGCPSSTLTVTMAIQGAIEEAAPEVAGVEVEGVAEPPPSPLLQIQPRPAGTDPAASQSSPAGARTSGPDPQAPVEWSMECPVPAEAVG